MFHMFWFCGYTISTIHISQAIFASSIFYCYSLLIICLYASQYIDMMLSVFIYEFWCPPQLPLCIEFRGRRGRDRVVVGFITTYASSAYHQ